MEYPLLPLSQYISPSQKTKETNFALYPQSEHPDLLLVFLRNRNYP